MEGREEIVFLIDDNEMSMLAIDRDNNDAKFLDISGGYQAKEIPLALYQLDSGGYMVGHDAYLFMEEAGVFYTAKELRHEPHLMERYLNICMNKIQEIYPQYSEHSFESIEIELEVPNSVEAYKGFYKKKIAESLSVEVDDKHVERLFYEHRPLWLKQLKTGKALRVPLVYGGKMSVLELTAKCIEPIREQLRQEIIAWQKAHSHDAILVHNEYARLANLIGVQVEVTDWLSWSLNHKVNGPIVKEPSILYYKIRDKDNSVDWDIRQPITWVAMDGVHSIDVVDTDGIIVFTGLLPKALHGYLVTMKATIDNHHIISEVTYEFRKL